VEVPTLPGTERESTGVLRWDGELTMLPSGALLAQEHRVGGDRTYLLPRGQNRWCTLHLVKSGQGYVDIDLVADRLWIWTQEATAPRVVRVPSQC
jgi:hypothetical protein